MSIAKLSNCKLNYLQINHQINKGNVEDIVMIHGLATNLAFWYPIANNLIVNNSDGEKINTRITLFDLTGHGRSSMPESGYSCTNLARQLWELTKYLKLDKFHLIAHSFGGSVAVDFINLYPEKVKSLVLADARLKILQPQQQVQNWQNWQILSKELSNLNINLSPDEPEAGIKFLTAIAKLQTESTNLSIIDNQILGKIIPLRQNKQTAKKWLKLIETTTALTNFAETEAITKNKLKEISEKTFLIYGEKSPNLTTKIDLENNYNFHHNYIVYNAGHFFPLSQPQICLEQIGDFIATQN